MNRTTGFLVAIFIGVCFFLLLRCLDTFAELNIDRLTAQYEADPLEADCSEECRNVYQELCLLRCVKFKEQWHGFVADIKQRQRRGDKFDREIQDDFAIYGSPYYMCRYLCAAAARKRGEFMTYQERLKTKASHSILVAEKTTKKICQLVGDRDWETGEKTNNLTTELYDVLGTDEGQSFVYKDRMYFTFGDGGFRDVDLVRPFNKYYDDNLAYVSLAELMENESFRLRFETRKIKGRPRAYCVQVQGGGVTGGCLEVPHGGFEYQGVMYMFFVTNVRLNGIGPHGELSGHGRSVLAKRREDKEGSDFSYLYDFSEYREEPAWYPDTRGAFMVTSPVVVDSTQVPDLPKQGKGILIFGTGFYRYSRVYLAYIHLDDIEKRKRSGWGRYVPAEAYYFAGISKDNKPIWRNDWQNHSTKAKPLFEIYDKDGIPNHYIGEVSVVWDTNTRRFYMTYDTPDTSKVDIRGVNPVDVSQQNELGVIEFRYTEGACYWEWSKAQVVLRAADLMGRLLHQAGVADGLSNLGVENKNGRVYAPFMIQPKFHYDQASGREDIYFLLSTGNPYTVLLMKTQLLIKKERL